MEQLTISGEVWYWRGPAPYHFVTVPPAEADDLKAMSPLVSYGWGMIPVAASIGVTTWTTSLWPKDGAYVVPLKDAVRAAEDIELGDVVTVRMRITPRRPR
jgi:Domain of unknown function (DUF1905)